VRGYLRGEKRQPPCGSRQGQPPARTGRVVIFYSICGWKTSDLEARMATSCAPELPLSLMSSPPAASCGVGQPLMARPPSR